MIDVHCHLADNKFKEDLSGVIQNAINSGVEKMVVVPEFESQFDKVLEICDAFPNNLFPAIGVHPIQKRGKSVQLKHIAKIEQYLVAHEKKIVCVGEVGLDHTVSQFKLSEEDFKVQEQVFEQQIRLARQFDMPLNVHSRSAARKTIECLRNSNVAPNRAVLHAFDGSLEDAKLGIEAGYLFSVPPSFAHSEERKRVVQSIPLHLLLLETDSPALGPIKGVKNVPENARISAEMIASVKGITVEEAVRETSANASRVFRFGC